MRRVARLLVVAALGLAACIIDKFPTETDSETGTGATSSGTAGTTSSATTGTTEPPTTGTTGGPAATCPDHANVDACCCFDHEMSELFGTVHNVCGETPLCPLVTLQCDGAGLDGPCTLVESEADLDCVLQALAGAAPGTVATRFEVIGGYPNRFLQHHLVGDGTAYLIDRTSDGETSTWAATGRYMLKPAAFFADCLAGMVEEKAGCVQQAVVGDATEVCVEAFTSQDVI